MKRAFFLAAVLTLAALPALADDTKAGCPHHQAQQAKAAEGGCVGAMEGVQRTATNLDNGVRIEMTATDPKVAEKIQAKMTGEHEGCEGCPVHAEGVTSSVEKTDKGVVITATSADGAMVKKLQEHGAKVASAKGGCCAKAAKAAGAGCSHGAAKDAPAKS